MSLFSSRPINIGDYRELARRRLPRMVFDFLEGGAGDETGTAHNEQVWRDIRLIPRRLTDVSQRSQAIDLLGQTRTMPVVVAPTGLNGLLWPQGDLALARAAADAGIPFTLSSAANASIEEIARHCDGDRWFQLYVVHRDIASDFVARARAADYSTLVVTTDVIVNGLRERDVRNGFGVPARFTPRTILDGITHPRWSLDFLRHGVPALANFATSSVTSPEAQAALMSRQMDASFTFEDLSRIRDQWAGKLLVKGLLDPRDVARCAELGVDGVVLSNHGGRQLDNAVSPADVLAACRMVAGNMAVLLDGGIRRGAHVAAAISRGAHAVMLGRALLYGLAARGQEGVADVLRMLRSEIDNAQVQLGAASLADLYRAESGEQG
jgi:(S)-mandelate dehydrogenase